jgi:hypothetical protein
VNKAVLLDTGPLGMVTHPDDGPDERRCLEWATNLRRKGVLMVVPEIADYELRRELIRLSSSGIANLEAIIKEYHFLPLNTEAFRLAADLWAHARTSLGKQAAGDKALDGDMILCAQARLFQRDAGLPVEVATTNVKHLDVFVVAREWEEITP